MTAWLLSKKILFTTTTTTEHCGPQNPLEIKNQVPKNHKITPSGGTMGSLILHIKHNKYDEQPSHIIFTSCLFKKEVCERNNPLRGFQ